MARSIDDNLASTSAAVYGQGDYNIAKMFGTTPDKITPEMRQQYDAKVGSTLQAREAEFQSPDTSVMGSIFSAADSIIAPVVEAMAPVAAGVYAAGDALADPLKAIRDIGGAIASGAKSLFGGSGGSGGGSSAADFAIPSGTAAGTPGAPQSITPQRMNEITAQLSGYKAPTVQDIQSRYIGTQDQTVHALQGLVGQQDLPQVQDSRYIGTQDQAIANLARSASGAGPSPAQLMLAAQNDANTRQAMALAASTTGRSLPAVQRQIMQQAALGGQQAAQQSAILRAQEMLGAQSQYAQAAQGARGQDINMAGLVSQQNQFSNQQELQAAQAAAAAAAQARGQDISTGAANQSARLQASGLGLEAMKSAASTQAGLTTAERGASSQDYGTGTQAATAMAGFANQANIAKMQDATTRETEEAKARAAIIAGALGAAGTIAVPLINKPTKVP